MSTEIKILAQAEIRAWLKSLIRTDMRYVDRPGVTLGALAHYTGIPRESLRAYAIRKDKADMSRQRQAYLSKIIGLIENGYLDFEGIGRKKRSVLRDKPIARPGRAMIEFTTSGPKLRLLVRPPIQTALPQIKGIKIG